MKLWLILFSLPCWAVTNSVTITDTTGSTQTNRPFSISRVFKQGEITAFAQPRIGGTPLSTWQCDKKTSWGDGSLSHAIISFTATVTGNGSITVDFVNNANPSSAGNQTATNAAALDGTGMLAFNSSNWNEGLVTNLTTGGSPTGTLKARDVITAGNFRYWLRGPVVTEVIAEDRTSSLAYDMGLDSNKSIHPYFVLTFYVGWAGVKSQFIAENVWRERLQDQVYNITLKTGSALGTTVFTKSSYTHTWQARWRETFWDGSTPGAVNIDFNLPYLTSSKALANYDTSLVLTNAAITEEVNGFNSSDQGVLGGHAQVTQYMPDTGGRPDIGLIPRWHVRYLYNFGTNLTTVMLGDAAVGAYVPLHVRESATGLKYDLAGTVDAFGRSISLNALPNVSWDNPGGSGSPAITGIGAVTEAGWTVDIAHIPNIQYVPYLVTGDYYWLEELHFWAAVSLMFGNPNDLSYGRHDKWGYLNISDVQARGQAWGLRAIAEASFMSPDGTPEKLYFQQMLDNNIAIHEGLLNLTTGTYYNPASNSQWYWGHNTINFGASQPLTIDMPMGGLDQSGSMQNLNLTCQTFAAYMDHYKDIAYGHIEELGFSEIAPMRAYMLKASIHQMIGADFNPYVASESYWSPLTSNLSGMSGGCTGTDPYFANWGLVLSAFYPDATTYIANATTSFNNEVDTEHGYGFISLGALAFATGSSDGSYTGLSAWTWIHTNLPNQNLLNANPKWAFLPRDAPLGGAAHGGSSAAGGSFIH